MKKIEVIDQSVLGHYREKWSETGLSTEPADREKAEEGIDLAYQAAGLKPPANKIWVDSPLQGSLAAAKISEKSVKNQVWDQFRSQAWNQTMAQVRAQVSNRVTDQVTDQVWDKVQQQVGCQVSNQVWSQVWNQVRDQLTAQVWARVWARVLGAVFLGQHAAAELSRLDLYLARGLDCCKPAQGLIQVTQNAGWCFLFEDTAILTERTSRLIWRGGKCVHVEYPDGFCASKLSPLERLAQAVEG